MEKNLYQSLSSLVLIIFPVNFEMINVLFFPENFELPEIEDVLHSQRLTARRILKGLIFFYRRFSIPSNGRNRYFSEAPPPPPLIISSNYYNIHSPGGAENNNITAATFGIIIIITI